MAIQLAARNNTEHPFKDEIAGKKWVNLFLKRHKTKLSEERKPTGTSYSRALGSSKENTEKFYNLLEDVYEKGKFTPDRIYNFDESSISVVHSKAAKVIGLKGKKQIAVLTSGERGALLTAVAWAPPGTIFEAHPSGWIQINPLTQWFQHFIEFANPTKEKPVLLLLDDHFSHPQNIDLIDLAKTNHVTIVSLPSHSSYKLQPLDKSFMGPLKVYYCEEIRQWLRHNERTVSAFDAMDLFGKAHIRCQAAQISVNGFKVTGTYPSNKSSTEDENSVFSGTSELELLPGVSPPKDDDVWCTFGDRKFLEDSEAELWVMCVMCSLWAHVNYAGAEKDVYICDFCR
ncbi:hypothetical protein PR048_022133 [Dryococelus australis]|uniref:DDE-1 domain-containing protein n=1 Tax=Dryococelus australis TaxID=614101 RepID=A0ABQ9H064_9NEOP|nr:hypothetical protein PR048_022133 [Dryococelus australis]